jgi:hypothetical protein
MNITHIPEAMHLARQSAINDLCQGDNNTPFHRALANVFLDFQQGKISKERYEELTDKLLKP